MKDNTIIFLLPMGKIRHSEVQIRSPEALGGTDEVVPGPSVFPSRHPAHEVAKVLEFQL